MTNQVRTTPEFLTALLAEIEQVDPLAFPPTREKQGGDKVIGEITGWTQKCAALGLFYKREVDRLAVELKYESEKDPALHARYHLYDAKADLLFELLWMELRAEFDKWCLEGVGIRKGWLFVEAQPGPRQVIQKLFGME